MVKPLVERPHMPDYGVERDNPDGLLPWEWAEQRLTEARNYWVVTVGPTGMPHAMPVWGVWLRDAYWFSSSTTARKVRNIATNPNVTVTGDSTVEVVSLQGTAALIDDESKRAAMVAAFVDKYLDLAEGTNATEFASFIGSNAIVRVAPQLAFGMIERPEDFSRCATRWRWQ